MKRHVERALAVRAHGLLEDRLRAGVELGRLLRLLRERLDDVDADDVLLGHRRHVRELLLHLAQRRVGDVAIAVGDHDEHRVIASAISASFHWKTSSTTVTETTVIAFWKKKIRP